MENHQVVIIIILIGIIFVVHFLPTIVACSRRHRQRLAIFVLNLFASWTGIGWIVALVWACTSDVEEWEYVIEKRVEPHSVENRTWERARLHK